MLNVQIICISHTLSTTSSERLSDCILTGLALANDGLDLDKYQDFNGVPAI